MQDPPSLTFLPPIFQFELALPLASFPASAGFPSPADDHLEGNRRMGRDIHYYAASGIKREWAMAANMKSRDFTTDWQQLLQIRA